MNQFRDVRSVEVVPVIRVQLCIGEGVEEDPVRIVTQWWDQDGKLIVAEADPYAPDPQSDEYKRSRVKQVCELLAHPGHGVEGRCACGRFDG